VVLVKQDREEVFSRSTTTTLRIANACSTDAGAEAHAFFALSLMLFAVYHYGHAACRLTAISSLHDAGERRIGFNVRKSNGRNMIRTKRDGLAVEGCAHFVLRAKSGA
jgi:hypothetical protein